MTKVTLKDTDEHPREMTVLGVKFKRGVARDVPDRLIQKFRGMMSFEVDGLPYQRSPFAQLVSEEVIDEVPDDGYTADQLVHVLIARKIKIPAKIKDDPEALMALCESNGGAPEAEELADYEPAQ